jgi:hypothetical protein
MEEIIALVTKTYGIAGLIMLSPFVGLVFVWKHNLSLQRDLAKVQENSQREISKVQESRVSDAKAMSEKILTLDEESSATARETSIALDQVRDLLMKLTTSKRV